MESKLLQKEAYCISDIHCGRYNVMMIEIADFLEDYKKSAKIINKLKKEIDNYNKQIGNMSSINYELELNYVDTNIASITKNLKEVETNITQLLTYNSQFEKYVLSDRELNDKKSKLISTIRELNNKKDEIIEKWSKFNIPNTNDPIQFQKELDIIQRKENDLIQQIQSIEDKMSLLSSEISSSKAMLNTDERISRMDLNSIYNTIDSNNELLNTINKSILEIENKYELDGFSGGLGIAASIMSTISNKKIDNNICFIGVLDLYGQILRVNRLKDKIIT